MAHAHGARIIVDGAQIVAHREFSMKGNTPDEDIIKHQKRWTFENGKVTVHQTIKTLEALSVDGMLCCMFPAYRSAFPYGIRQGRVEIEDMTTDTYTSPDTVANEFSYFMYGSNCTAKISSKLCDHTPLGDMWINPTNRSFFLFEKNMIIVPIIVEKPASVDNSRALIASCSKISPPLLLYFNQFTRYRQSF